MVRIAIVVLVVIVVGILVLAAMKPDSFRVERSTSIAAPPEKIYPLLADFRKWPAWSPWEKKDPAMKRTHSGAASGIGAQYAWAGNKDVGSGRMEIVEATPPAKLNVKLDFLEPFEGHNTAEFTLEPSAGGTRVNWAMYGPSPFLSKVMQVFMSFDRMIGRDFEEGLANLKAAAEK
jgi:uncharacterized protein YndB with AHSA1/START domain